METDNRNYPTRSIRSHQQAPSISATRVAASVVGVFSGLRGLEHGYFETLQGNVAPSGIAISAIGSPCKANVAWHGCEPAMTLIPNFLVTGVAAIIVSLIVIMWAALFIQWKNGGLVLILLTIIQLLVGGGFTPLFVGATAGIAGTRINASSAWWRSHLSTDARRALAGLWPWPLVASLVWTPTGWILGAFYNGTLRELNPVTSLLVIGDLLLVVITGFACDMQRQSERYQVLSE